MTGEPHSSLALIQESLEAVGDRLRNIRKRRKLTLADVADRTGVSISTLSRLESGRRRPTLDLLVLMAAVYRVALEELVGAPLTGDPRIHLQPIRQADAVVVPLTGQDAPVQAVKMVLPVHHGDRRPVMANPHGGYEWLYVLRGAIDLWLSDTSTRVRAGEAAEFDTRQPHGFKNASAKQAAEVLSLFSREGHQIHVHDT